MKRQVELRFKRPLRFNLPFDKQFISDKQFNSLSSELQNTPDYRKYKEEYKDNIIYPFMSLGDPDPTEYGSYELGMIVNNKMIGYAYFNFSCRYRLTVRTWYIQPEYLNEDYGKALFSKIAAAAIDHKCDEITLKCPPQRHAMKSFFLSLGARYRYVEGSKLNCPEYKYQYYRFSFPKESFQQLAGKMHPCKYKPKKKYIPQATTSLAPLLANIKLD